jgi:hypothetical protein
MQSGKVKYRLKEEDIACMIIGYPRALLERPFYHEITGKNAII